MQKLINCGTSLVLIMSAITLASCSQSPIIPSYNVLYNFESASNDGSNPATFIQGANGNFYGVTQNGGQNNYGSIYQISYSSGQLIESLLYSFESGPTSGAFPSSIIQVTNGNLYGTTQAGGANNLGVVFKYSFNNESTSIVYSFTAESQISVGSLIQAQNSNIYGVTQSGITSIYGGIYMFTPSAESTGLESGFQYVYNFESGADGATPATGLIEDKINQILYGATTLGGANNSGVIYQLIESGRVESTTYNFGPAGVKTSVTMPNNLTYYNGALYGTAESGATNNFGAIYKLSNLGSVPTLSYIYAPSNFQIFNNIVFDAQGNLYCSTRNGSLLMFTPGNAGTLLYSFNNISTGINPNYIYMAPNGLLYGTTINGGNFNSGVFFSWGY
jgi:uncharacterized repeat protein (TIGR03803 family)